MASRVIGLFEGSIEKIVALAALMPIVAGIGGNSGNQTTTMIVRGLALGQISVHNLHSLIKKELGVALLNGLLWGSVLGLVARIAANARYNRHQCCERNYFLNRTFKQTDDARGH